jgi:carboxymethylenebutenolidase
MTEKRQGSEIQIAPVGADSRDEGTRGYLVLPASGSGPGVVVVQEWWGLVDHIRDVCDRLAREGGVVALAPDLYRGVSTGDPAEAERLRGELEIPRANRDLDAAVQALLSHEAVEGAKVGCLGFGMGGQLALHAASRNRRIGAVVDCYGVLPHLKLDFSELQAAVFGVFAENDDCVSAAAVRQLEAELRAAGGRILCNMYLGVQHAFMNDSRPEDYDAPNAEEAWSESIAFLRAELG